QSSHPSRSPRHPTTTFSSGSSPLVSTSTRSQSVEPAALSGSETEREPSASYSNSSDDQSITPPPSVSQPYSVLDARLRRTLLPASPSKRRVVSSTCSYSPGPLQMTPKKRISPPSNCLRDPYEYCLRHCEVILCWIQHKFNCMGFLEETAIPQETVWNRSSKDKTGKGQQYDNNNVSFWSIMMARKIMIVRKEGVTMGLLFALGVVSKLLVAIVLIDDEWVVVITVCVPKGVGVTNLKVVGAVGMCVGPGEAGAVPPASKVKANNVGISSSGLPNNSNLMC
ncbi:hypothetical protein BGW80DRAFT_1492656, partial [Lactifluus volemus]